MLIKVVRRWFGEEATVDRILINERPMFFGLEDQVRLQKNGKLVDKIYGESAIPYGEYEIEIVWWAKHSMWVPAIKGVSGFDGILIHPGATDLDTLGCLLVGENFIKDKNRGFRLVNSKKAFDVLFGMIKLAKSRGETVKIKFVNYEKRAVIIGSILIGFFLISYFAYKSL